ncbi:MAG TPA: hypothetical protein VLT82_06860 [Myxococcaceae bacterium]|nr:hypothetical protein [Myxococcaceae bacterium]
MTAAARKHTFLVLVVLSGLAVLSSAVTRQVAAYAAVSPAVEANRDGAAAEPQAFHTASGDRDVGPGDAEPTLARHAFQ